MTRGSELLANSDPRKKPGRTPPHPGPARRGPVQRNPARPDGPRRSPARTKGYLGNEIALIDLLDRLLHGGVVVQGDITLAVADIDLVKVDLRLVISSIDKLTLSLG